MIPNITISFFIIALLKYVNCKVENHSNLRNFSQLGKLYNTLLLCENLAPESVTMNTVCMSSCATTFFDEGLKCNPQAETWKIRLNVDRASTYYESTGIQYKISMFSGCKQGQKRFRCFPYMSNEGECDDESALVYPKGYSCFTKCGVKTCPSESFKKPKDAEDLKIADCTNGFRVRCSFNEAEEGKEIGTGNLTLELKTKTSNL